MLLIAFVVMLMLKLAHVVAWSWWIICSPLLVIGGVWVLVGLLGLVGLAVIGSTLKKVK